LTDIEISGQMIKFFAQTGVEVTVFVDQLSGAEELRDILVQYLPLSKEDAE